MSLLEADSWEILALAIVEFTEQSLFNLVNVLDLHVLRLLFDFNLFEKCVATDRLAVLALVFFKHCLDVLSKLGWVLETGNGVVVGELSFQNLLVEKPWELDNHSIAE